MHISAPRPARRSLQNRYIGQSLPWEFALATALTPARIGCCGGREDLGSRDLHGRTVLPVQMGRRIAMLLALAAGLSFGAGPASAAPCPGAVDCPYTTFSVFGSAPLARPQAIAVDSAGNVIAGDQQSGVVRKFDPSGLQIAQWGSLGSAPGQFGSVGAIAADAAGNVYVLDSDNDRVEKFDPNGNLITTWGRRGTAAGRFRIGWKGGIAVGGSFVYV